MAAKTITISKGRPSKLTEENVDIIVEAVRRGSPFVVACQAAGINEYTRMAWMREARNLIQTHVDDPETIEEYLEVKLFYKTLQAEAEYKSTLLGRIKKKSKQDWKAAAWLLSTRWPKEYGQMSRLEVTGTDGEPIKQELTLKFDKNDVQTVLAVLAKAGAIRMGGDERAKLEMEQVHPTQTDDQAGRLLTSGNA